MSLVTIVQINKPPISSIGSLTNDMRSWLDHEGIQPLTFKSTKLATGDVAVDVEFRHNHQAKLFRGVFGNQRATAEKT